ncbi:hypothetical protein SAMN05518672_103666 [Chitinophaga sp. CF118]|uniref:hypothetical protein n=1 Tax=Chitinophaga sp. CF118 TaxID=1884367 RepID=UPI0008DF7EA3|nr:hypothetical protein [Chitinophaga sp. CF118]SFD88114.1 hypothetical protein SAMN05518672_103666 [Chitinophaga sp. CF118]
MNKEAFDLSFQETDKLILFHESIYCRQEFPVFQKYKVQIKMKPENAEKVKDIVSSYNDPRYGERVLMFITVREDEIELYTDTVYNPYYAYYSCIATLAEWLENATFFLYFNEENDEGELRYVVDKYVITDGVLDFNRDYTEYGEDDDNYWNRIDVKRNC